MDLTSIPHDIAELSSSAGRPLRPYQLECARAIIRSIDGREGRTFSIMFGRQMGKNETAAQLEAYLLARHGRDGGSIVKAAPSFRPQILNSILRLKETLNALPATQGRWTAQLGHMIRVDRATIAFYSASPTANVVGATASLLLEIDEAQDVDPDKYDRDFRPMASSTNATTVLYGTAWSEDSLLERTKRYNLELERRTGERLHFEYDWTVLAALNPHYRSFVEGEIERLGENHPSIQTQYLLRPLSDAGRLFSAEQRAALAGTHGRAVEPENGAVYVAGIDLAGEDEQASDAVSRLLSTQRDSTVVTIAEVTRDGDNQPVARVVDHVWWTGRDQVWQYERLAELCRRWNLSRVCVDASGIGAGIASFLAARFGDRVERFVFTAPSKSALGFAMLAMINTGRLSIYANDGSPEWRQCQGEIRACRYALRAGEQLTWSVPDSEGHDDFVVSLALAARAAESVLPPPVSRLIRPQPDVETW